MVQKTVKKLSQNVTNVTECCAMGGGTSTTERRHEKAIALLIGGASISKVAEETGYSRGGLSRLLHKNPIFQARLNRARIEARDEIMALVRSAISEVVIALRATLKNTGISPNVTLQATLSALPKLLELMIKHETGCIDERALTAETISSAISEMFTLMDTNPNDVNEALKKYEAELDI